MQELRGVPYKAKWDEEVRCSSLLVIPGKGDKKSLHDSGYRCLSFVAVNQNDFPISQVSGCSDVIDIEGIGGYGRVARLGVVPKMVPVRGWSIDCLPKSGCLRLFVAGFDIICGVSISTFEVYSVPMEKSK
jgi:hypothetical protein